MTTMINGLRYFEVDFNADGSLNTTTGNGDGGLAAAVSNQVPGAAPAAGPPIADLFVFAHGWNNGVDSARDLYNDMFKRLSDQLGSRRSSCAAVGILWPSMLFPDDDPATAPPVPSTGAQIATALAPAFPDQKPQLTTLGKLLDEKPQDPHELAEFHSLATHLVTTDPLGSEDAGESSMIAATPIQALGHGASMASSPGDDAEGIVNPFSELWSGAREVLRTMSYYEMKNRAGVVGKNGLGPFLAGLRLPDQTRPPNIHLIGHSFGARLVSYTLAGLPTELRRAASPVKSLTLIQGAFSHFAFAAPLPIDGGRSGGLADFRDRVDGPMLATFTGADRAVGWWYPAASFLARQDSESASDVTYRWGAMGHDGYQQQPAAKRIPLANTGTPYDFERGAFYAIDSNDVIKENQSKFSGAHSDIRHDEVLWAVACASRLPQ